MSTTAAQILIVEDEAKIRANLEKMLEQEEYQVVSVGSGEAALERIAIQTFDLALLDLKLPGIGGIEVLTALRKQSPETVVVILTAHASLDTAVEALRQGAHDYLFKPCKPAELLESIRRGLSNRQSETQKHNLLRELEHLSSRLDDIRAAVVETPTQPFPSMAEPTGEQRRFWPRGRLIVDLLRHAITVDDQPVELTPLEFELLTYLVKQAPRVVPPSELVRAVLGYDPEQFEASQAVRTHIYHIRQKIKKTTGRTDVIRTIRGVGYTIVE
jgi:DNA-binding response OmpR family regulator